MAVMCHLAIEPSDKFVLMTTVISLDSVVSHLGWEEAQRLGSLGWGYVGCQALCLAHDTLYPLSFPCGVIVTLIL